MSLSVMITYKPSSTCNLTWEDGMAHYKMYAREVGFLVRTWTTRKHEHGVPVWKSFVCAKHGWRMVTKDEERIKSNRNFKLSRCGCEAMIGFKSQDDVKYEIARFVESHTQQLISPSKRQLIKSNREVSRELRSKLLTCHIRHWLAHLQHIACLL